MKTDRLIPLVKKGSHLPHLNVTAFKWLGRSINEDLLSRCDDTAQYDTVWELICPFGPRLLDSCITPAFR